MTYEQLSDELVALLRRFSPDCAFCLCLHERERAKEIILVTDMVPVAAAALLSDALCAVRSTPA